MRRKLVLALIGLILVAGAAFWWWSRPLPVLNVVTWPGLYGRAQAAAQIQAWRGVKRVDARIQQWAENGTLEELRRTVAAGHADVVDLEMPVAVAACKAGLLEPIDIASLPAGADGTPADKDFHKGTVNSCFVASAVYGQMIACKTPCASASMTGLFLGLSGALASQRVLNPNSEMETFLRSLAGKKIGLQRTAKGNLEMALLADGVPENLVYSFLNTEVGIAKAFAKLDTIKPQIVWWSNSSAPIALLRSGQVAVATMLTADAQAAAAQGGIMVWQNQFYEADVLAVPKGTAKKDMAMDYIRFATGSAPLADMVKFAPYMPPRKSAMALVEKLPASPTRDFVASQKGMLEKSFAIDDAWWAEHGMALEQRFRAWADAS